MKLSELRQWRDRAQRGVGLRGEHKEWRIVISMGTSGIASGAREIMHAIMEELENHEIDNVEISVTGSLGMDHCEPMLEVLHQDQSVCYGHLDVDAGRKVVTDHILKGVVLDKYVIGLPKENA